MTRLPYVRSVGVRLINLDPRILLALTLILLSTFVGAFYYLSPRYALKSTTGWEADGLTSWSLAGAPPPPATVTWNNTTLTIRPSSPVATGDKFSVKESSTLDIDAGAYGFLTFTVTTSGPNAALIATIWTSNTTSQDVMLSTFADAKPHQVIIDLHFQAINKRIVGVGLGLEALQDQADCWVQFSNIQLRSIGTVPEGHQ